MELLNKNSQWPLRISWSASSILPPPVTFITVCEVELLYFFLLIIEKTMINNPSIVLDFSVYHFAVPFLALCIWSIYTYQTCIFLTAYTAVPFFTSGNIAFPQDLFHLLVLETCSSARDSQPGVSSALHPQSGSLHLDHHSCGWHSVRSHFCSLISKLVIG